ncbi:AAA family ATPase [Shivajiella indica]|uniref:ATP-binding protein n=1 Tax=Shivajiella indica TaxID=872115 RepID=A0ABW5B328_9BACT
MKSPENPFVLTNHIGKKYFCNRENELKSLLSHVENNRNLMIYGWRGLGKSTLVHRFFDKLENKGQFETLFIDMLPANSLEDVIKLLASAIFEKYGRGKPGISSSMNKLFFVLGASIRFDPYSDMPDLHLGPRQLGREEQSLQALGEFLKERKKQVIIAMDEFQQLDFFEEKNTASVFRNWMLKYPEIRFVFCGNHPGKMLGIFAEKSSPLYQSAQLIPLLPLQLDHYTGFIQDHFKSNGKYIPTEVIEMIFNWSRGQTYIIQLVCNYLFAQCTNVRAEDFMKVSKEIIEQYLPVFATFPKMLTKAQWNLLKAIAKEEPLFNPMSSEFLIKHQLGAASTVSTALKSLQKQELVFEEDGGFFVQEVLLSRWMKNL